MSPKVREAYERAMKDREFLAAILSADGDHPPSSSADPVAKAIFAGVYYGWLVAKYGDNWRKP